MLGQQSRRPGGKGVLTELRCKTESMALEFPAFDVVARQILAREIACWSALGFDDLVELVGMRARSSIDERDEITLAVALRWVDGRSDTIEITVAVEAPLALSQCRLVQSIRVARTAYANSATPSSR